MSEEKKNWWDDLDLPSKEPTIPTPTITFPKGTDNPFHDFAITAKTSLDNLQLDGTVTLPTGDVSFDDLARRGAGWKLHLNFNAQDQATVQTIGTLLTALQEAGAITVFKIGNGGGKDAGQPGKEATIGVGHRDKAHVVASLLEEVLLTQLIAAEGETLRDDIPFSARVMGRFDVHSVDPDFHQYGAKGHPILNIDMSHAILVKVKGIFLFLGVVWILG